MKNVIASSFCIYPIIQEKIENKEEPSVICSIKEGIFNGCVTPW
tara:strand:- start:544 stop:675 length:132 start_codon:yes stop_codon:yes gene_type:complete